MVLRSWLVQGLDVKWIPSVDPREAYAPFIRHKSTPDSLPCVAGSGKSIVWLVILLFLSCLQCSSLPQVLLSYNTLCHFATPDRLC